MRSPIVQVPNVWEFELKSNSTSMPQIANEIGTTDIVILSGEEHPDTGLPGYIFTSPHFKNLKNAQSVVDRATILKALLDGALIIEKGFNAPFSELGDLYDLKGNRVYSTSEGNILAEPFNTAMIKNSQIPPKSTIHDPFRYFISQALFLSRYDLDVRGILAFLGFNGINWISLYAIKDFLSKNRWKEDRIALESGSSKAEVNLFGHTANNFQAIGPYARHGASKETPPKVAMKIKRASEIILPAAKAYIISKSKEFKALHGIV